MTVKFYDRSLFFTFLGSHQYIYQEQLKRITVSKWRSRRKYFKKVSRRDRAL